MIAINLASVPIVSPNTRCAAFLYGSREAKNLGWGWAVLELEIYNISLYSHVVRYFRVIFCKLKNKFEIFIFLPNRGQPEDKRSAFLLQ
jgi:hypothetical protein